MKRDIVVLVFAFVLAAPVTAAQYRYEVDVEGMVCAYCAYSVGKRLAALDGVAADSVDVDLKQGQVRFACNNPLPESELRTSLKDAGFRVTRIEHTVEDPPAPVPARSTVVLATVSLDAATINSTLAASLLDSLGAAAMRDGGRFVVRAPAERETAVLKPLIGGRKKAIKVAFEVTNEDQVTVTLLQLPHEE